MTSVHHHHHHWYSDMAQYLSRIFSHLTRVNGMYFCCMLCVQKLFDHFSLRNSLLFDSRDVVVVVSCPYFITLFVFIFVCFVRFVFFFSLSFSLFLLHRLTIAKQICTLIYEWKFLVWIFYYDILANNFDIKGKLNQDAEKWNGKKSSSMARAKCVATKNRIFWKNVQKENYACNNTQCMFRLYFLSPRLMKGSSPFSFVVFRTCFNYIIRVFLWTDEFFFFHGFAWRTPPRKWMGMK